MSMNSEYLQENISNLRNSIDNIDILYNIISNENGLNWLITQHDLVNQISSTSLNSILTEGEFQGGTILTVLASSETGLKFLNIHGNSIAPKINEIGLNATIIADGFTCGYSALSFLVLSDRGRKFLNTYGQHIAPKFTEDGLNAIFKTGLFAGGAAITALAHYDNSRKILNNYGQYIFPKINPIGCNSVLTTGTFQGSSFLAAVFISIEENEFQFLNTYWQYLAPLITEQGLNTPLKNNYSVLLMLASVIHKEHYKFLNTYGKYIAPKITAEALNLVITDTDSVLSGYSALSLLVTSDNGREFLNNYGQYIAPHITKIGLNTVINNGRLQNWSTLALLVGNDKCIDFVNNYGKFIAINITAQGLNTHNNYGKLFVGNTTAQGLNNHNASLVNDHRQSALSLLARRLGGKRCNVECNFLNTYGQDIVPHITEEGLNTILANGESTLLYLASCAEGLEFLNTYGEYIAPKITATGLNTIATNGQYKGTSALFWLATAEKGMEFLNIYGKHIANKISSTSLNTIVTTGCMQGLSFLALLLITSQTGLEFLRNYGEYLAPKLSAVGLNTIINNKFAKKSSPYHILERIIEHFTGRSILAILANCTIGCEFLNTYIEEIVPKINKEFQQPSEELMQLNSAKLIELAKQHLDKQSINIAMLLIDQLIVYDINAVYQEPNFISLISERLLKIAERSLAIAEIAAEKITDANLKNFLKAKVLLKKKAYLEAYKCINQVSADHVLDKVEVEQLKSFLFNKTNISAKQQALSTKLLLLISSQETLAKKNLTIEIDIIKKDLATSQKLLKDLIVYSEKCEYEGKNIKRNQSSQAYKQELEHVSKKLEELNKYSKEINALLEKYLTNKQAFENILNGVSNNNIWLLIEAGELADLEKAENFILILENQKNKLSKLHNDFAKLNNQIIDFAKYINSKLEGFRKSRSHININYNNFIANNAEEKVIQEIEAIEIQIKVLQEKDAIRQKIDAERRERWKKQMDAIKQDKAKAKQLLEQQKAISTAKKHHKSEQKEKQKTDNKHRQTFLNFVTKLPNLSDYIERERSRNTIAASIIEINDIQQQLSQLLTNPYLASKPDILTQTKLDILLGICVETMEKVKKLPKINPMLKKLSRKLRNVLYHGNINSILNTYTEAALPQFIEIFCYILKNHTTFTTVDTIQSYFESKIAYQDGLSLFQAMHNYVIDGNPKIKRHAQLAKLQASLDNTMKQIAIYESNPLTADANIPAILSPAIRYQYGKLSVFFKKLKQNFKSEYDELTKMLPVSQYRKLGNNLRHGNYSNPSSSSITSAATPDYIARNSDYYNYSNLGHSAAREDKDTVHEEENKWESNFKF